ncbi:SH3-like domain-containing protein [Acidisoma silvae]|uniref:Nitrile hydratase subunit beta n=1 Tax=Acidisoma silvae TaxID=2802396 RepID=A0A964DYN1_9PROT|nr:SH3-like domain-containing protein [Acidisoma silvae]MCB8875341.1 nitrile hydratase subunit beta [Acidisoma silvae]
MTELADKDVPRALHDMGGVSRYMCEAVDTEPHELTDFDREVDAIRQLLGAKSVMSVDELRRGIEALPEADYLRLSYYQRWLLSMTATLLQKGVFTQAELAQAMKDIP